MDGDVDDPDALSVRVSLLIHAPAETVIDAFILPARLRQFWLSSSDGALAVGKVVRWRFMVQGAEVDTSATSLDRHRSVSWDWSDGTSVEVHAKEMEGGTAVTIVNVGFQGGLAQRTAAALNATEGFALVLADLKTLLENGASAGIVRDKARLIEARAV